MSLDAVGLEVMGHAFASIAEEMGLVLIHSAVSPNIRERRDCSAALFDAAGAMIAQAAHIPVHLGALHESVAAVRVLAPAPGDVFILNDPYAGGSHLPDITLVGAVEVDGAVGGYGVVRAHHSDVGGMQAGPTACGRSRRATAGPRCATPPATSRSTPSGGHARPWPASRRPGSPRPTGWKATASTTETWRFTSAWISGTARSTRISPAPHPPRAATSTARSP